MFNVNNNGENTSQMLSINECHLHLQIGQQNENPKCHRILPTKIIILVLFI